MARGARADAGGPVARAIAAMEVLGAVLLSATYQEDGEFTDDAHRLRTGGGHRLYLPNARFDTTPGPDVEYQVVAIPARR